MSYLLPKIKEDGLVDFLLNQSTKTAYVDDVLVQKYPKSESVDDIICMLERHVCYDVVGFVDYSNGKIVICKDYIFSREIRQQPQFINLYDLRANLVSTIEQRVEKEKEDKLAEIKATQDYIDLYNHHKPRLLEAITIDMMKDEDFELPIRSYANQKIAMFVNRLKDDEVLAITSGETAEVDNQISEMMKSKDFMFHDVLAPTLLEEAAAMIASESLSERLLTIKNYIDKTKTLEDIRFTVETTGGSKLKCNNEVFCNGKIISIGKIKKEIDIESIEKVTYNKDVIYEKGVF